MWWCRWQLGNLRGKGIVLRGRRIVLLQDGDAVPFGLGGRSIEAEKTSDHAKIAR
jgi:hypothetical protein